MSARGNFQRRAGVRKLRQPFDEPRIRSVECFNKRDDLSAQLGSFGNDIFERREIGIEALRQA
ncbi:MAG: hypothetical protein ABSE67_20870 [Xanthobacteraceae bacterium]|jgi:hypothetical protein